jgi:hypothetical protein
MGMLSFRVGRMLLLGCTLLLTCITSGTAASTSVSPILVELFTSEGCSDCPPADSFLRTLDSTQPIPGAQLIVLEEHVDYWDDLGWQDPFSSHAVTVRQAEYVSRMRLASAYTPQMVVDGAYQFVGSNRRNAAKAFESARLAQKIGIRITSLKLENGMLRAHVESETVPAKADVLFALVTERADSQVLRGENGGHSLQHVAIVHSLSKLGKAEKGQPFSKDINLELKSVVLPGRLIVFLQEPNQGKVLGVAVQNFQN